MCTTLLLRYSLIEENRRRDHLLTDEYNREAGIVEPCDWVRIESPTNVEKLRKIQFSILASRHSICIIKQLRLLAMTA